MPPQFNENLESIAVSRQATSEFNTDDLPISKTPSLSKDSNKVGKQTPPSNNSNQSKPAKMTIMSKAESMGLDKSPNPSRAILKDI